jgi:RNA polymerase sigma factor (sigma-70 family)
MGAPEDSEGMHSEMGVVFSLGDESLDALITAARADPADDSAAMAEILRRFEGAAIAVARLATGDWHLQQDAAQGARLGLVRAVRAHTLGTPGFPSYALRFMKGAAKRIVSAMVSPDIVTDPLDPCWLENPASDMPTGLGFELPDIIWVLNPEQQDVTLDYYVHDLRLQDIADRLGISKPAVSQRLTTIHRALRPTVEKALAA